LITVQEVSKHTARGLKGETDGNLATLGSRCVRPIAGRIIDLVTWRGLELILQRECIVLSAY
jgi:hypothetical protein